MQFITEHIVRMYHTMQCTQLGLPFPVKWMNQKNRLSNIKFIVQREKFTNMYSLSWQTCTTTSMSNKLIKHANDEVMSGHISSYAS